MASLGLIESKLQGLPEALRQPLKEIFTELTRNLRFGHPLQAQPDPAMNFASGFFTATTAAISGEEFTLEHNFGRSPYLAMQVLALDTPGAQIVPLTVTRATDARRIYLSSSAVSAEIILLVEG